MNREIKFRYYSKYSDGSLAKDEVTLQDIEDGYFKPPFLSGIAHRVQYTGLKDKNGKEIYEKDIVKAVYGNDLKVQHHQIKWDDLRGPASSGGWIVDIGNRYGLGLSENTVFVAEILVIGNIYENPELLTNL